MYTFDFSIILKDIRLVWSGLYVTILVSILSGLMAFVLGTFFVYFRTDGRWWVSKSASFLISCIRNTPLLILIFLFYKGLPSVGIVFSSFVCGVLALGIYSAAYVSDALLSGVNTVQTEQLQASASLGLNRFQSFFYVILPQALRNSIFILGSQFMNIVKNSSLVSFIAVSDIFYVIYRGISDSYRIYEYFILALLLYCTLTGFVLLLTNLLNEIFKLPEAEVRV